MHKIHRVARIRILRNDKQGYEKTGPRRPEEDRAGFGSRLPVARHHGVGARPHLRDVAHAVRRDAHPVLVQRTTVIPSYTLAMKTAISVPDDTFRRVDERAAALGMSRSEFYSRAAEGFLERLDSQSRVEAINDALARSSVRAASDAASIGQVGLERIETLTRDDEW